MLPRHTSPALAVRSHAARSFPVCAGRQASVCGDGRRDVAVADVASAALAAINAVSTTSNSIAATTTSITTELMGNVQLPPGARAASSSRAVCSECDIVHARAVKCRLLALASAVSAQAGDVVRIEMDYIAVHPWQAIPESAHKHGRSSAVRGSVLHVFIARLDHEG